MARVIEDFIPHATPLTDEEEQALRDEVNRQLPKMEVFQLISGPRGGQEWVIYAKLLNMLDRSREAMHILQENFPKTTPHPMDKPHADG